MEHLIHSFLDAAQLLPFLFLVYLLVEYLEHKNNSIMQNLFAGSKRFGPLLGAVLGTIPQCGFSVIAAELFSRRAISMGTLIAIFIATSDEAIPLMLTHPERLNELLILIGIKFVIAVVSGFLIDLFIRNKPDTPLAHSHHHFHGNCESCEGGILRSAIIHAVKIFAYIFIINIIIGLAAESISPLLHYISSNTALQALLVSAFGIIPNCAASVALTELYLAGGISLAALIGGLCTGAGVGLLVLFKKNNNLKQNLAILGLLFAIGTLVGIIL